ncbi:MAG: Sulfoacetaldehyde dehydrogenase (acylating) [Arenicellales bacterium IbO2]|nr:MAG: Sulfoacetaldehyde dehydrogenase (acylating) [Arenicellales bacterium IbO2]
MAAVAPRRKPVSRAEIGAPAAVCGYTCAVMAMPQTKTPAAPRSGETAALVGRARAAMREIAAANQARIDELVTAIAWSLYKPQHAEALAELAVRTTGIGNAADKTRKNRRKTFGTLRDLLRVKTVGVIESDEARGLVKYGKPVGVVAAVTPSTNPAATPVNKAMMAVKGGNAIIIAPSPAGWETADAAAAVMRGALARAGAPQDLVQVLPRPVTREKTRELMREADLVVATGSQNNVAAGYASGTPCIGVGAGNVPVIIDSSADLEDAAEKIRMSKTFDNSTSCSSENALIILDDVYARAMPALAAAGAHALGAEEKEKVRANLWRGGKLNPDFIAKDAGVFAERAGLGAEARAARFFLAEEAEFDASSEFADEKLSLLASVYRAADFNDAVRLARAILQVRGRGHSCGIHTRDTAHPRRLAEELDVVRVLVNQAHAFGNGGSFNNALNFTLSMGCGTWGGNSISENLNYRHFINITHLVTAVKEDKPGEEELFGAHFAKYGRD